MTREEVFTKLNEVFQDVFDDETICLTDESKAVIFKIGIVLNL